MKHLINKAKILIDEMLPYIQKFKGKIVVIKYGGNAMTNDELKKSVMKDIAFLKTMGLKPVVVHGGGPFVTKEMEKTNIKPKFINGLRVTDEKTVGIIVDVFGKVNNEIKGLLESFDVKADNVKESLIVKQKNEELGFVGEIVKVDKEKIMKIIEANKIPVVSPVGVSVDNDKYNINADTAATKIAVALKAEKLTILTNVDGVVENGNFISHLSIDDAHKHIKGEVITKGMIPKVEACIEAVEAGCKKAHLINGMIDHSLLFEIFTDEGIGTEIVKNGNN